MFKNKAKVRAWDTTDPHFVFPENDDTSPLYCDWLQGRELAVAVSGGGTVSVSLCAGYFKALAELDAVQHVKYVSGVSGGTWGSAPWTYYLGDNDDALYGNVCLPEHISLGALSSTPPLSLGHTATHAKVVPLMTKNLGFQNECYSRAIGEIFLRPLGIKSPGHLGFSKHPRKYFTTNERAVRDILARNAGLSADDFMMMRQGRPFLIMNTAMFVPKAEQDVPDPDAVQCPKTAAHKNYCYLFEMTPLYCGMRAAHAPMRNGQPLGGAYVESIGFDTTATAAATESAENGTFATETKRRFELCNPVGTSGAALQAIIAEKAPALASVFPRFRYWNPRDSRSPVPHTAPFVFGDGGIVEDTGVVALLLRGMRKIVSFLTSPVLDTTRPFVFGSGQRIFGYNQVAALFGEATINGLQSKERGEIVWNDPCAVPQVFDNTPDAEGVSPFRRFLAAIDEARQSGGPCCCSQQLAVVDNSYFGVRSSDVPSVTVLWFVVDECSRWRGRIADDAIRDAIGQAKELEDFPNVKVFNENAAHIIQLTPRQANLLGCLAYWMVLEKRDLILSMISGDGNGGDGDNGSGGGGGGGG